MEKYTSFNDWINDVGVPQIAKLLKVTPSTVRQWRRGYCYPKVDQMRTIKKATKGRVTYDLMIDFSSLGTSTNKGRR